MTKRIKNPKIRRHKAKVKGSTELVEVLGPTGCFGPTRSFGRDALRRVLDCNEPMVMQILSGFPAMQAISFESLILKQPLKQAPNVCLRDF